MIKKTLFGLLSLACILPLTVVSGAQPDKNSPVDRIITREVDLTRDGVAEKVVLHLRAESIYKPFRWSLDVLSKGKSIWHKEQNDARIDEFFSDPGYVTGCGDYVTCKEKWYFKDLLDTFIVKLDLNLDAALNARPRDPEVLASYDDIRAMILKKGGSKSQADTIVRALRKAISEGKAYALNLEISTVAYGPIAIWVPVLERFVNVWDD